MRTIDIVKKRIIISMIAILLLIITLFGITYAYFIAKIRGNEEQTSINAKAGKLELTYGDGNGVLEVGEYLQPGNTVKFKNADNEIVDNKTFTVTNTGTANVPSYEIILENVINELEYYEDLTYTLTCTSYINYGKDTEEISGSCDGNEDIFPKTNGLLAINSIDEGVTHYYVLKLHYAETNTDQSNDMKKNIVAKINIQDDESSLKSMLIYGNSIQNGTPSVSIPIEIESVGDRTINLLKTNLTEATSSNGEVKVTNNNGEVHVEGTATKTSNVDRIFIIDNPQSLVGKTLITKTKTDNDKVMIYAHLYTESETVWNWISQHTGKYSNVVPEGVTKIEVGVQWYAGELGTTFYPQIEVGDAATEYEPYGYKIPLKISGSNLYPNLKSQTLNGVTLSVDNKGVITLNGTCTASINFTFVGYLDAGTYSLIDFAEGEFPSNSYARVQVYESDNTLIEIKNNFNSNTVATGTVKNNSSKINFRIRIENGFTYNNVKLKPMLIKGTINEGEITEKDYEPYVEPKTINIYLDEPLRKIGDYIDYIDFANRRVVRNVGVSDDSGTKTIEESLYGLTRSLQENISVPLLIKESIGNVEILTEVEPSKLEY